MKLNNRALQAPRRRPWRGKQARVRRREVMITAAPPLAQIDIYEECVVLTRRDPTGAWRSYPIDAQALAQALGKLPITPGLLPPGTIAAGLHEGDTFYLDC